METICIAETSTSRKLWDATLSAIWLINFSCSFPLTVRCYVLLPRVSNPGSNFNYSLLAKKKTNNNKSFSFALKCWLLLLRPWRACLQQIAMPLLIFVFVIMFSPLNTCVYVCKGWGKFVAYGSQINCCRLRYLQTKVLWCCAPHTLSLSYTHTLLQTHL